MHTSHFQEDPVLLLNSFYLGLRFDVVVMGYLTLIPLLILFIFGDHNPKVNKYIFNTYCTLCCMSFIISIADIEYFNTYKSHINTAAFHWMKSPVFVVKMLLKDTAYLIPVTGSIVVIFLYTRLVKKIYQSSDKNINLSVIQKIAAVSLLILSIRGRLDIKSPIRIGTAYFSDNALLNELGLNGNFVLARAFLDQHHSGQSRYSLVSNTKMQSIIEQEKNLGAFKSCTNTQTNDSKTARSPQKNIVLILMESMGKSCFSSRTNCYTTPFLDSLIPKSIYFNNFYSSGIHTFNGIFSTLYSIPSYATFHPLKFINKHIEAIPSDLQKNGYHNLYFTTHDGQFDNVEGFLHKNDFKEIITDDQYPQSEIKTNLGVTDEFMFKVALKKLAKIKNPFFCTMMTASNHTPFYIPEDYEIKFEDARLNSISYADYALKQFFKNAKTQSWYENTIFVLLGDHGIKDESNFPVALSYNEIPLIIFDPSLSSGKIISNMGSQIDVLPTVAKYLNVDYCHNNFGVDIINNCRPYIAYNYDDKYAVVSDENIYVSSYNQAMSLLFDKDTKKPVNDKKINGDLHQYGGSILQYTRQYIDSK